jgi:hypothetical protein
VRKISPDTPKTNPAAAAATSPSTSMRYNILYLPRMTRKAASAITANPPTSSRTEKRTIGNITKFIRLN